MEERNQGETNTTDYQAHGVCHLGILKLRKDNSPKHTAHSLDGEEDAHPVTCLLERFGRRVGGIPNGLGDSTRRVIPKIEETSPAEELHQAYLPESGRSIAQERNPISLAFLFLFHFTSHTIIGSILLRIPLLHLHRGIDDTKNQNRCSDIKRPDHGIRHYTLGSIVLDTQEREEEWEDISSHRAGIAEETLDRVSFCLLLLIDHIADQHLERLHRHIDAGVQEHQGYQTEEHRTTHGQAQRTSVWQQAHHQDSDCGSYK